MVYKFTGTDSTTFPSIALEDADGVHRTLVMAPGDTVELASDPCHPALVAQKPPKKSTT